MALARPGLHHGGLRSSCSPAAPEVPCARDPGLCVSAYPSPVPSLMVWFRDTFPGTPFRVELRIVPGPGLDPRFVASAASELVAVWGPLGVDVVPFTKALSPRPATGVTMVIVEALPAERQANALGWVGFQDDKTAAPLDLRVGFRRAPPDRTDKLQRRPLHEDSPGGP